MIDLEYRIDEAPLIDTHEHLWGEATYTDAGPDILQDLFDNYVLADLAVAGASEGAVRRLTDGDDPDVAGRFNGIRAAWERSWLTAERVCGMDEITPEGLEAARERNLELRPPGDLRRALRGTACRITLQIIEESPPAGPP